MARVEITVNGRPYQVGCEDGQEAHLHALAAHFDQHVGRLAEQVGQIGDLRLFLMAALMVCDELSEARAAPAPAESQPPSAGRAAGKSGDAARAAETILRAAERVEALAARVEAAS